MPKQLSKGKYGYIGQAGSVSDSTLPEQRFDKAFFIMLGLFAVFFPIILIPILGPILVFTFVPYFAGYNGGKYINRKDGLLIAMIVAVIWTIIEILILFSLMDSLNLAASEVGIYTRLDWILVLIPTSMNIIFSMVGSYFTERKVDITA